MSDDEVNADTPAGDWDTADLDDDASEERERLRAKLGLIAHAPPRMIDGRYEILDLQGQGGMGVVYHARDLRLDRDVALKLVRVRPFSDEARLRERLELEAKALAKLDGRDHVVAVYDVGRQDDRIYFTMPYIQGVDLRQWQDVSSRTVDELVDVYLQAARGLAAAHAHGIVHRDFKPANVLVRAEDQRALVADFGIAEAIGVVDDPPDAGNEKMPNEASRLTATGVVLGTLPYVAPERLPAPDRNPARGAPTSDQFSFCVALWEALAGEVPFPAESPGQMLAAVEMPPRGAARIPRWLRPLLRRGLARDPADRFSSMDELILAIERRRDRTVKAALITLGLAVVVGVLAWVSSAQPQQPPAHSVSCSSFADAASVVWNDERRLLLNERRHLAPESIDYVREELDALMERWLVAATGTCWGNDAPPPGDPYVECLEHWLRRAENHIVLLIDVDDSPTAAHVREVVDRLRPPTNSYCAFSPPPAINFDVWEASDAARAAAILGDDTQALELATRALELAQAISDDRPHTADLASAHAARAEVYTRQQRYVDALLAFEDADVHAHLSGHRELEISNQSLWAKARALSATRALDLEKALEDIERTRRLLVVVSPPELRDRLEAELEDAAGFVEFERERYDAAVRHHESARQLLVNLEQPVLLAKALNNLGRAHQMLDQSKEAIAAYRQARAMLDTAKIPFGHSVSLVVEFNIGLCLADDLNPEAFTHFDIVALSSGGEQKLQALDEALALAVNLEDESRMRTLSQHMLDRISSSVSLDSLPLMRIKFHTAAALILLADPQGDELYEALDKLPPDVMPPDVALQLREDQIRALETRRRCKDAAAVLAGADDLARANGLVDDAYREWRAKRVSADCKLPTFLNQ